MDFKDLVGKTIEQIEGKVGDDRMSFFTTDDRHYQMWHKQDCCESVFIEDICGDLESLLRAPILEAEEVTSVQVNPEGVPIPEYQDCFTWTFYKIKTAKGAVTIRWYGSSNGYYSESVGFEEITQ